MKTEEEDLLQAVLEYPNDDGPRRVIADWYDEHGDPDRATYIRAALDFALQYVEPPTEHLPGMKMSARQFAVSKNLGHIPNDAVWEGDPLGGLSGWAIDPKMSSRGEPEKYAQYMVSRNDLKRWFPLCFADPLVQWTLRRGWPYKMECHSSRLIGGSCLSCRGEGTVVNPSRMFVFRAASLPGVLRNQLGLGDEEEDTQELVRCNDCKGTGFYPNLHDVIGSRFPLTEIRLTDKRTSAARDHRGKMLWSWYREDQVDDEGTGRTISQYALEMFLPPVIFNKLRAPKDYNPDALQIGMCSYGSEEKANTGLSNACIKLIRLRAKLTVR